MHCVILAGGLATRLHPVTKKIPKSMVMIGRKPFLEHQIDLLKKHRILDLILCVGYLGEQIESYFGNGDKFGVRIRYSYEKEKLLGTGGAIRNAFDLLDDQFFVLYGDSYLDTDYKPIHEYFIRNQRAALLVVFKNNNNWDTSNIVFKDGVIWLYDKENRVPEMEYIDYGLSILSKDIIKSIPKATPYDLAHLYKKLVSEKLLVGYEVKERFFEIGSKKGLKEFENMILRKDSAK